MQVALAARMSALLPLLSLAGAAIGHKTGLIGYGQWWYDPPCAYACRAVIGSAPLDCTDMSPDEAMNEGMHMHGGSPMAPCIAQNTDFLSTLAYCLGTRCAADSISPAKLEAYWTDQATGDPAVPADWTYGAVLANITRPPTRIFQAGDTLNYTALISNVDYSYQYDFNRFFDWEESVQSTYVIVLISVGAATPVVLSALSHLPFMDISVDQVKPYLVYPSTFRGFHIRPLPYLLRNAPTMGQGLLVAMFTILNIILAAVTYKNFEYTHPWGFTKRAEILAYVGYRTGHISFALLPLTVLFSSRNNFLLWITDWPFSTFIVLHRWVARLCALHAITHSITLLAAYISLGTYYTDVHTPYWMWGIVGTLCLVLLLFQSLLWFRRAAYEAFLALHILLAVFAIVGCWYHIHYWKGITGIYELWIYMACAVWFFDRLARLLRVVKNGIHCATVVELCPEIVRLDIHGIRWATKPGYHAYIHFPTLKPLRAFENHPFSVTHTALLRSHAHSVISSQGSPHSRAVEVAKDPRSMISSASTGIDSISIYIRKHKGITSLIHKHSGLPVMLDGPYRGNTSREVLKCDRVLLIGGGIGITGLLAWAHSHMNVKLAWSVKHTAQPLVQDLETALAGIIDKVVQIDKRLDMDGLLAQEIESGWRRIGVVVCGPAGLCDSVRLAVARLGQRQKTVFELEVDAFSW